VRSIALLVSTAALFVLYSFQTNECVNIPPLNKKIAAYLKPKIGKNVGYYCDDFIKGGYEAAGLTYWGTHNSEKKIDYTKECVYPGDIIVLGGGIQIIWKRNDTTFTTTYDEDREFFICKVKSKGVVAIARTETVNNKHKVVLREVDLNTSKKGKPRIYRLEKK
jgi:hypothetical protein